MQSYLAAAVQMTASDTKEENLEKAESLVRGASRHGATLVVLPEVFSWRGKSGEAVFEAESIPGPTTERLRTLAQELEIHLITGSFLEKSDDHRSYNTSLLISPEGRILARYRKIHLFDVDIPNRVTVKESENIKAGEETAAVTTAIGNIGLSICYDLRFPELYRQLVNCGAQIVSVPSAFTFPTGTAHWEVLLRARAVENQVYLIAPNQIGPNVHGFSDYGHSMIVDPWGKVAACAEEKESFVTAEINLNYLSRVRKELPCLEHQKL